MTDIGTWGFSTSNTQIDVTYLWKSCLLFTAISANEKWPQLLLKFSSFIEEVNINTTDPPSIPLTEKSFFKNKIMKKTAQKCYFKFYYVFT